jgi:hypothetical protein
LRGGFLFCWGEKMIYEWRLRKKNWKGRRIEGF